MEVLKTLGHQFDHYYPEIETSDPEAHKRIHDTQSQVIRHGKVECETDSQSAHDTCHRRTIGPNSRHVERRVFKMKELQHAGKVIVKHISTKLNSADMFTKPLDDKTFAMHRAEVMNLPAKAP